MTSVNFQSHRISILFVLKRGGGVQAYNFGKYDFETWVEEEGHVATLLGWFWVRVRPRSKNGAKNQNLHIRR